MKVRTGFVSNSSSSSFCIFGTQIPKINIDNISVDEICRLFPDMKRKEVEEAVQCYKDEESIYEYLEFFDGLEYYPESDDGDVVGVGPTDFKDDETGKQFKERVAMMISAVTGNKKVNKIEWLSGEYAC